MKEQMFCRLHLVTDSGGSGHGQSMEPVQAGRYRATCRLVGPNRARRHPHPAFKHPPKADDCPSMRPIRELPLFVNTSATSQRRRKGDRMAIRRRDDDARPSREPGGSRFRIGRIGRLNWTETCVLKAACDVAQRIGEWRLGVDQIEDQLTMLGIVRDRIETALDPIVAAGYISLDDAP